MQNHGRHLNPALYIDAPMRTIAVSWLVEVACEYGLHQETLFLSTMLLDSFLAVAKVRSVMTICAVSSVHLTNAIRPSSWIGSATSMDCKDLPSARHTG